MTNRWWKARWACRALVGLIFVLLYLGFDHLYLTRGLFLSQYSAYAWFDVLFEADVPRVIDDLTDPGCDHYRSKVHPLFVLFFNPIGAWLKEQTDSDLLAGMKMTASAGGLCTALLFAYLLLIRLGLLESVLLSLLYGFTASQLIWSSVPDTYVYAAAFLLLVHILFALALRGQRLAYVLLPLGGVAALAITITNYAQALIIFVGAAVACAQRRRNGDTKFLAPAVWAVTAIAVSLALAMYLSAKQKGMYPSCFEFYRAEAYTDEMDFVYPGVWKAPFHPIKTLALNFGAFNVIAPPPEMVPLSFQAHPGIAFTNASFLKYNAWQYAALLLWLLGLVHGAIAGLKQHRLLFGVLVACLGFNLALHSIYGIKYTYLYTAHLTFLLVGIAGLGFLRLRAREGPWRLAGLIGLASVLIIEAYYNLQFMYKLGPLLQFLSIHVVELIYTPNVPLASCLLPLASGML